MSDLLIAFLFLLFCLSPQDLLSDKADVELQVAAISLLPHLPSNVLVELFQEGREMNKLYSGKFTEDLPPPVQQSLCNAVKRSVFVCVSVFFRCTRRTVSSVYHGSCFPCPSIFLS